MNGWEDRGRKYRMECQSNEVTRFILCLVLDLGTKSSSLFFPRVRGL